ncbi:MAG: hemerythrin domain-containing protein [Bacteroidales bacterium]|jgi:regulator of cell morphogenesis and NO signaling|nr:hemerythrin domain-containing protein [Bacteroidales bacterium]
MKLFNKNTPIADAIINHPDLIVIFERLNIPLGVQELTIQEYAEQNNISQELLLSLFNLQVYHLIEDNITFNKKDTQQIIDYLKSSHDYYTSEFYPVISKHIKDLINHNTNSEFQMLQKFFDDYLKEVEQHFEYEDETVFPYIRNLTQGKTETFDYAVEEYKQHHDDIEAKLEDLISLLVKFLQPGNDIKLRRKIIETLARLDEDLQIHARIENEILIPLAETMEAKNHE